MEIILKETIDNLGREGEIVKVKPGYGRNYLIPKQKAVLVDKASLARLEKEKQAIATRLAEQQKKAEALASQLEGKVIIIKKRTGDDERLFGSVTSNDIGLALEENKIIVDKKAIILPNAIKAIGEYKVSIKTGYQTTAQISVQVMPESTGDEQ